MCFFHIFPWARVHLYHVINITVQYSVLQIIARPRSPIEDHGQIQEDWQFCESLRSVKVFSFKVGVA